MELKTAKELIKQRKSVRTFDGRPLSAEDRKCLEQYVGELSNPFGINVEFRLLDAKENNLSSQVIVGAETYLTAKVKREGVYEIAFGYSFEKACLYALSLGMGTVILAGTLSRSTFEKAMDVQNDEVLPAASPVGYPAQKRSMRETLMRKAIKADERLPFSELFYSKGFDTGLTKDEAGIFADALEMVRLSPSAANKQPCRAVADGSRVHFFEKKSMKDSPLGDIQKVDIGIALAHFDLSMQEDGFSGQFLFEEPGFTVPQDMYYMVTYEIGGPVK